LTWPQKSTAIAAKPDNYRKVPSEESIVGTDRILPLHNAKRGTDWRAYAEVLKPRETLLLGFAGLATAVLAGGSAPLIGRLFWTTLAVTLGSAGANGLTNYLDRDMDERMERTRRRPIPSRRIWPAEKMLPLAIGLVLAGLVIAWALNFWAFAAGLAGIFASVIIRKRSITHVPLGEFASCAPFLIGWLGVNPRPEPLMWGLCGLIFIWTPIHVWSLMEAYRDDYLQAGVRIFPLTISPRRNVMLLFGLAITLSLETLGLPLVSDLGWLYFVGALAINGVLLLNSARLLRTGLTQSAWRMYKLSAYPYLGIILTLACVDRWLSPLL
jgi:protoheme IX farnesyltransferase